MTLALGAIPASAQAQPSPTASPLRAKLGAYYFDGWTGKTFHITERLKTEFAHREPVWGWRDDSPEVMRRQIDIAADHGIAFFAFDWYWPEGVAKDTPLNHALGLYRAAPNRNRLQFCLMIANHGGFRIGPKDWDAVCSRWLPLFQDPTHLTVDGKPLLIFFSPRELLQSFGSPEAVKAAFDRLRGQARAEGLPGLAIAACATPGPENGWDDLTELKSAGFDLLTGYNYPGAGRKGPEKKRPFDELVQGSVVIWDAFARKSDLPYIPAVTAGFDKRPWDKPDKPSSSVWYEGTTPEAIAAFVARAVAWLDSHEDHATRDRLVVVYAWNENGEGGYLTPTKSGGSATLEAIQNVLRSKPTP